MWPEARLTGFIGSILGDRPHRAFFTNHPKRGDLESFSDALAGLTSLPYPIFTKPDPASVPVLGQSFAAKADQAAAPEPASAPAPASVPQPMPTPQPPAAQAPAGQTQQLAAQVAPLVTAAILPEIRSLIQSAVSTPQAQAPAAQLTSAETEVYCTGAAVGLPGGQAVFASDNIHALLSGDNRISKLNAGQIQAFLDKNITRLHKDSQTGQGRFISVDQPEDVIRLAGVKSHFDLAKDYGVSERLIDALDITTQLAFAAGIEALKDAGIPLVPDYRQTSTGKQQLIGWQLPESMRTDTGIIFACAFPGYTNLINHLQQNGQTDGRFDRRFLFQILAMGHSQFAQFIGAKGPNTQVNAACASTTQAIAMASDWIRAGRANRVIVIGADDVTNESMLSWIGAGFLAAGAATTTDKVEEAALPFDRRRHGMILGMGAVGLVLENQQAYEARGIQPIAKLLATHIGNSAFHGTRLLPEHIAEKWTILRAVLHPRQVCHGPKWRNSRLCSHETFTPAKGGPQPLKLESLRRHLEILQTGTANTKGLRPCRRRN